MVNIGWMGTPRFSQLIIMAGTRTSILMREGRLSTHPMCQSPKVGLESISPQEVMANPLEDMRDIGPPLIPKSMRVGHTLGTEVMGIHMGHLVQTCILIQGTILSTSNVPDIAIEGSIPLAQVHPEAQTRVYLAQALQNGDGHGMCVEIESGTKSESMMLGPSVGNGVLGNHS